MTIIGTRLIQMPDRRSFLDAFPQNAEMAVEVLQGVTLRIGATTIPAPVPSNIYRNVRIAGNNAEALRLFTTYLRRASIEDLHDFMYLLDDTLSGPGVPAMGTGQEFTITYMTAGDQPNTDLLNRLRDRTASYGNYAHYSALAGGIRVVYDRTGDGSRDLPRVNLARFLPLFFMSNIQSERRAARSIENFHSLFVRGYVSYSNQHPQEGDLFYASLSEADTAAREGAAQTAVERLTTEIRPPQRANARLGAVRFFLEQDRFEELDRQISGNGLSGNGLQAHPQNGFRGYDEGQRRTAGAAADRWRTTAQAAVSAQGSNISPVSRTHLVRNIEYARVIYRTALNRPDQLPRNMHSTYYSHLNTSPNDIWGAYKGILAPSSRQMAERMAYEILVGWNPDSGEAPPGLARSLGSTLRSLAGME